MVLPISHAICQAMSEHFEATRGTSRRVRNTLPIAICTENVGSLRFGELLFVTIDLAPRASRSGRIFLSRVVSLPTGHDRPVYLTEESNMLPLSLSLAHAPGN